MPTPVYMTINDLEIKGSVEIADRRGTIEIVQVEHDLHIPTDIHSGKLTGVRQHGKMVVRAAIDAATPYLYKACTEGIMYNNVLLDFYKINAVGTEEIYYHVLLERVQVSSVVMDVPQVKMVDNEHLPHMVEYAFVYGAITWTFDEGTLEHKDDWVAAR